MKRKVERSKKGESREGGKKRERGGGTASQGVLTTITTMLPERDTKKGRIPSWLRKRTLEREATACAGG